MFSSARDFLGMCVLPLTGALILTWAFVQSVIDLANPLSSYTCGDPEDASTCANLFGMGVPLALSIVVLVLGLVLLVIWRLKSPAFFKQRREVFRPEQEAGKPAA